MRSVFCIPIAAPLLLAGCATTFHAGAPKGAVDVIAHRGASAYAPENTLASFRKAIELQADWFELDVRLTRDNQIIVMHNADVDKTTNGTGRIADLTLAELKQLDAGSWFDPKFAGEPLATLAEALDLAKDRIGVYIEVKNCTDEHALIAKMLPLCKDRKRVTPKLRKQIMSMIEESGTPNLALTRKVIETVRHRNMQHQVVIQSFSPVIVFSALSEAPDIRTEFLGLQDKDDPGQWPAFLWFGRLVRAAGANVNNASLTPALVKDFHEQGRTVAVWTIDDEADMRRLADWGVDALIGNKPDVTLRTLKAMGKH